MQVRKVGHLKAKMIIVGKVRTAKMRSWIFMSAKGERGASNVNDVVGESSSR